MLKPAIKWFVTTQAKKALPNYNENLTLDGLTNPVEIIRDQWAIPHVYAQNQQDLFFAQGYLHAQDRLWQMELTRRVVAGRLCEVVGKDALDVDRLSRAFGFKRLGEQDATRLKDHELFGHLSAYIKGINAFIETMQQPPVEFKLLKIKPEKWTAADCFGMARLLALQMSQGWLHEIERMGLADKFGLEKAQELFPDYPAGNPAALKYGIETNRVVDGKLKAFEGPYLRPLGGSNNWVVAPHKMETGTAALCNDPHLLVNVPNIWYENHLVAPDYNNTGVSIPGVPMILIGHNAHIAWGATLTYADIQDTYIEDFVTPSCTQYRFGDRILKANNRTEKIYIKGEQEPHIEKVITTHHGPVILDIDEQRKLALCSKALQENDMMLGFYQINMAKDWDGFVLGCKDLTVPSLSLVYADTDQNIGYYMTGEVPIRNRPKGLLPNSGSDAKHEWKGRVPFEEMPHVFNPEQGYFYTCNHKLVDDEFPYDLGNTWMNGYRAKRLDLLLNSKEQFNFKDFAAWQLDFYCLPGVEMQDLLGRLLTEEDHNTFSGRTQQMLEQLMNWDGYLTAETIGGTVYQVLKEQLIDVVFETPKVLRAVTREKMPLFETNEFWGYDIVTLFRLLNNPASAWWKEQTPVEALCKALVATEQFLTKELGADMKTWKWGALHQMTTQHALGIKEPLDEWFNGKTVAVGGDADTVCTIAYVPGKHYSGSMIAASYRQLIDMGDFSKAQCAFPGGQSGNLESKHYQDQFDMWAKGMFKTMLWTREQVEANKAYQMEIKPA